MEDKDISIENKVKELRKRKKLSQEELAEALGISRQSIIAVEQGRTMPSLPLAVSLCQFFDSAFEEMFEFENEIDQEIHKAFSGSHIKINVINAGEQPEAGDKVIADLLPWRPFEETVSLRDAMDRLFEDNNIAQGKSISMPKIDIKDFRDKVIVKAELPGIDEDEINVEILDSVMTISGEKKEEQESSPAGEEEGYFYKESHSGSFSRSFNLPADVAGEKAEAAMDKGILTVIFPKVEPKKAKKIEVKKK